MNNTDLLKIIESMAQFTETLAGLRNSLIAQGFSEAAAEEIVLLTVRGQVK